MEFTFSEQEVLDSGQIRDIKDPCPVFDGNIWHIFGSRGTTITETWKLLHATSPTIDGPWVLEDPVELVGVEGDKIAAPGVIYDFEEKIFHMFVHSSFLDVDTHVYHLASSDGKRFELIDISFSSVPGSQEASIYDPHPAIINGKKFISYSGAPAVGRPDIYLAESETNTWYGPWERLGMILSHNEVPHHNQHDHPDYEWGLEGSQLIELPDGRVLLNAVCFLPEGPRGTRQRVFFAVADNINTPFKTLGPVIQPPSEGWDSGENGHAAAILENDVLTLFYQARPMPGEEAKWRYGKKTFSIKQLLYAER
jgi:hypothetical protein